MATRTPGGYCPWECISALQKAVRRAQEPEALHWFLELEGAALFAWAVNRLRIVSHEDIGLADPTAALFANHAFDLAAKWKRGKNDAWKIAAGNGIRALCRAKKSREGDHFQAAVQGRRADGWHPDIPDFALDKHTRRGKKLGRGLDHFRNEGTKLVPPPDGPDPYEADAYRFWKRQEGGGDGPHVQNDGPPLAAPKRGVGGDAGNAPRGANGTGTKNLFSGE